MEKSNRRRHANILPVAQFATWIIIAAFACSAGLYYVYCKHQLIARGKAIHSLEREAAELRNLNEGIRTSIAKLSSPSALRARRDQMLAGYTEISQDHLVFLSDHPGQGNDLRPVSNPKP